MPATRPRLAIISPVPPFPPLAGGTRHIYGAAVHLARYYEIELLALADEPTLVRWGALDELCASTQAFARSAPAGAWYDPPAARMERSVALEAHMRTAWVARAPAIVQLEYTTIAHYAALAQATGALTVCTALIVGFVAQVRRIRIERGARVRLRRLVGLLSLWQYELRALRRCDLIITLAESDEYALRRWLPGRPVVTVPSGIDLAAWPTPHKQRDGQLVLFVGNYAHPPNAEGACWLAREVWPLVLRACPDARLVLAGREPTPEIRALACDAISVPGTIDDLGPLHARASIGVAPIFWGGGLRIKLLEMMAAGLPIVATAQAADGLEVASCAILAETPAAFADAIIGLISDHARRERLGQAARTIAERRYNWTHLAERLAGLYEGLRAGKR